MVETIRKKPKAVDIKPFYITVKSLGQLLKAACIHLQEV